MELIADFQLHSKYARAVSKYMDLREIERWAALKGIHLVVTGDWQHPKYFPEIVESLEEVNSGVFKIKGSDLGVNFILGTEISSIYKQGGKVRKVHNLIFSPSISTCEKIIDALLKKGANLSADGRPIIGISSKNLLEMLLEIDENIMLIPAHIWTPWFGLLGSKSGFDSIEECFEDLSPYIYAIETGLSSDPRMNWQIKEFEHRSILSFSDAHSGPKMGREATVLIMNNELRIDNKNRIPTYSDIIGAFKMDRNSMLEVGYTIEFFPEEGKYHTSGHRNCNIKYSSEDLKRYGETCPVCKKTLTIGVENRLSELSYKHISDQELSFRSNEVGLTFISDKGNTKKPYVSMIQLQEILIEVYKSKAKALREYDRLVLGFATEFDILLRKSYQEIESFGGERLAQAIQIVRERKAYIEPGYDGVFGKIEIFPKDKGLF
jgi:uncharacterized protein (TIGR00375 family)